jgi:hypothetical protein
MTELIDVGGVTTIAVMLRLNKLLLAFYIDTHLKIRARGPKHFDIESAAAETIAYAAIASNNAFGKATDGRAIQTSDDVVHGADFQTCTKTDGRKHKR